MVTAAVSMDIFNNPERACLYFKFKSMAEILVTIFSWNSFEGEGVVIITIWGENGSKEWRKKQGRSSKMLILQWYKIEKKETTTTVFSLLLIGWRGHLPCAYMLPWLLKDLHKFRAYTAKLWDHIMSSTVTVYSISRCSRILQFTIGRGFRLLQFNIIRYSWLLQVTISRCFRFNWQWSHQH